jgi:hypothetical protein
MICTNHLLHRRPDPTDLPEEDGTLGTAALTYTRWKSLYAAAGTGTVVDRDDIREQFRAVRFAAPVVGARTFWHALYDGEDRSVEVAFYLRDENDQSIYSDPLTITLE